MAAITIDEIINSDLNNDKIFINLVKKLSNKDITEELDYYKKILNSPVIFSNYDKKNKVKNEYFDSNQELYGIFSKNTYLNRDEDNVKKKLQDKLLTEIINCSKNLQEKNMLINFYFITFTIKNNFSFSFEDCIDFDISPPEIKSNINCPYCKSNDIIVKEEHNRALDEPSKFYLECIECKRHFKV